MPEDNTVVYKIKVNGFEFDFTREQIAAADLIQTSPTKMNLLHNGRSVNAIILQSEDFAKEQKMEVEGETFLVKIKDELDQVLDKMGYSTATGKQIKEIKAPMPGLVLEINVTEGQQVKEGDKLLILVAMKMENAIMIHADSTIKSIAVKAGQAVEKGQVLVELQ